MNFFIKGLLTAQIGFTPVTTDGLSSGISPNIKQRVFTLLTDGTTGIISQGEFLDPQTSSECKILQTKDGEKIIIHVIRKENIFEDGDSGFEEMLPQTNEENTEAFDITKDILNIISNAPSCKLQDKLPGNSDTVNAVYG